MGARTRRQLIGLQTRPARVGAALLVIAVFSLALVATPQRALADNDPAEHPCTDATWGGSYWKLKIKDGAAAGVETNLSQDAIEYEIDGNTFSWTNRHQRTVYRWFFKLGNGAVQVWDGSWGTGEGSSSELAPKVRNITFCYPRQGTTTTTTTSPPQPPADVSVVVGSDADGDGVFGDGEVAPPGVPVTVPYRVTVRNDDPTPVEVVDVVDVPHGVAGSSCAALVGEVIAPGSEAVCGFEVTFDSPDQTVGNTTTVTVKNDGGPASFEDTSTVTIPPGDTMPGPGPGEVSVVVGSDADGDGVFGDGEVAPPGVPVTVPYRVTVRNDDPTPVEVVDVVDVPHGVAGSSCAALVGEVIAPGSEAVCGFEVTFDSPDQTVGNMTTVTVKNDGGTASFEDTSTVTIPPGPTPPPSPVEFSVSKTPSRNTVPTRGGDVTFTVRIVNTGTVAFDLVSLRDDQYGQLGGVGTCRVGQRMEVGSSYECAFTRKVTGPAGSSHVNVITATGSNPTDRATETASARVAIGRAPSFVVSMSASPRQVSASGDDVRYSIRVTSGDGRSFELESLRDRSIGNLTRICGLPRTVGAGGFTCAFTGRVSGPAGSEQVNVATAVGSNRWGASTKTTRVSVVVSGSPPLFSIGVTATPDEILSPDAIVTYTLEVTNQGTDSFNLTRLSDNRFGDLNGAGNCQVPTTVGATGYSCEFRRRISGPPASTHTNVLTAIGSNPGGTSVATSQAEVSIVDGGDGVGPDFFVSKAPLVSSVTEPGAEVTFTVTVSNRDDRSLLLSALVDDVYGDLAGLGCALPQTIAASASFSCEFNGEVAGENGSSHVNTVTATGTNPDGIEGSRIDRAVVTVTDQPPAIEVTKSANPEVIPEPGGPVTFTVEVTNRGDEVVSVESLADSVFGDLADPDTCPLPAPLAVAGSLKCSFTKDLLGSLTSPHKNTVTALGLGPEGTVVVGTADAVVGFAAAMPEIEVTSTTQPENLAQPGGPIVFTVVVRNQGSEMVTLEALRDSTLGDLAGVGSCRIPTTIGVQGSYGCTFTKEVLGEAGTPHQTTVTATVFDDDRQSATSSASSEVGFTEVEGGNELSNVVVALTDDEAEGEALSCGEDVVYTAVLFNVGDAAARVHLSLALPAGLTVTDQATRRLILARGPATELPSWTVKVTGPTSRVVVARLTMTVEGIPDPQIRREPTVIEGTRCEADRGSGVTDPSAAGLPGAGGWFAVEPGRVAARADRRNRGGIGQRRGLGS